MTAPLHERLAEAAKAANQEEWHITIGLDWHKAIVTVQGEMEDGDPSEQTLLTVNKYQDHADGTLAYLYAAQPANVAKLCEQVQLMKEALEQLFAINEQHNFDWVRVVGKPVGWSDKYLDKAREALSLIKTT